MNIPARVLLLLLILVSWSLLSASLSAGQGALGIEEQSDSRVVFTGFDTDYDVLTGEHNQVITSWIEYITTEVCIQPDTQAALYLQARGPPHAA